MSNRTAVVWLRQLGQRSKPGIADDALEGPASASVQAHALVECLARRTFGLPPGIALTWGVDRTGRPVLTELSGWFFSISHAGSFVAVAGCGAPIGIDIEMSDRRLNRTVERRLHPAERAYIAQADCRSLLDPGSDPDRIGAWGCPVRRDDWRGRLLEVWTMKEAYLKWSGGGISQGLASFNVAAPSHLGVRFERLRLAAHLDLVGALCVADAAPISIDQEWLAN